MRASHNDDMEVGKLTLSRMLVINNFTDSVKNAIKAGTRVPTHPRWKDRLSTELTDLIHEKRRTR